MHFPIINPTIVIILYDLIIKCSGFLAFGLQYENELLSKGKILLNLIMVLIEKFFCRSYNCFIGYK